MIIHDVMQGSPEWHALRANTRNASEAPAMMGVSPYKSRSELLRELHTQRPADVDIATQKRFDNGHRAEALARPLAEKIIGEDLYPVTGSEGRLSASFDGLTLDESTAFEHKALNADLRECFRQIDTIAPEHREAAAGFELPLHHRVQMEQQLHVSGAERILFMASEWDADGDLVEERHCWYYPDDELRGAILAGWAQLEHDLQNYKPEPVEVKPAGRAPETLPALHIEVTGAVTASNLREFVAWARSQPATFAVCSTSPAYSPPSNFVRAASCSATSSRPRSSTSPTASAGSGPPGTPRPWARRTTRTTTPWPRPSSTPCTPTGATPPPGGPTSTSTSTSTSSSTSSP